MNTMRTMRLVILGLIVVLLPVLPPSVAAAQKPPVSELGVLSHSLQELTTRVGPAVVQVFISGYAPEQYGHRGGYLPTQHGSGSGVILDPAGYIITNAHVVEGARRVQVLLAEPAGDGGSSILKARGRLVGAQVVRTDWETDLAVLKVQEKNLPFLVLGDSDRLRQGQLVLAFGSPLGLENSVSLGVVSARARQVFPDDPMIYIQTDAAINPGNSGGPLVDSEGLVVGINTFILTQSGGSEGVGFAAPSNIVRNVFEQIRDNGRVRRGVIGVSAQTVTPVMAAGLGLSRANGVILGDVEPGSPAARAGLETGDLILTLNGKPMENGRQFTVNLYQQPIGARVKLEVLRAEERQTITVEVAERADDPLRFADMVTPERNLVEALGILCLEIDERIARMLPTLRRRKAVVVAARTPGAAHWEEGFQPGDVIYALNGEPIHTLAYLRSRVDALRAGDAAAFQVERQGQLMYLALRL